MDQRVSTPATSGTTDPTDVFIARWQGVSASELATAQSFVIELCDLLGVSKPHATPDQSYVFERPLKEAHGDGHQSDRRVDCYKRGHFILEAQKLKAGQHTKGYDNALLAAHAQAQNYETFPFPSADIGLTPALTERIRALAEQLDAKDKTIHEQGLVSVLRTLHDELDAAVLAAYGWAALGPAPSKQDEESIRK